MLDKLSFSVSYSDSDEAYVGICIEFPTLFFVGESKQSALCGIIKLTLGIIEDDLPIFTSM